MNYSFLSFSIVFSWLVYNYFSIANKRCDIERYNTKSEYLPFFIRDLVQLAPSSSAQNTLPQQDHLRHLWQEVETEFGVHSSLFI